MNALENAKQLKAELDSFRPLTGEIEARIMQKFRLDWNFHSNNIEGNSLTYGETKALILFGITAQGKPLKDHFEITGHNEAINWVVDLVKGETELTEVFIRQLHEFLLKESHYKEAVTSEGKQTRRKIEVGKYKTQPNHVITNTGEPFFFATPEETPIKMQELVDWFRKERDKTGVNPIISATIFHYKFIRIHPFDDGNGRTARILMNFILMQFGFPPVIIRTEDKENYYRVLRLADADELEPFIEYIAENLVRSLEIMIKGAKGESIEEADDLDKELTLLEREFDVFGTKLELVKNKEVINTIVQTSVVFLVTNFIKTFKKFDRFYAESAFYIYLHKESIENYAGVAINTNVRELITEVTQKDVSSKSLDLITKSVIDSTLNIIADNEINSITALEIGYSYQISNRIDLDIQFLSAIWFEFNEKVYSVSELADESVEESVFTIEKLYSEKLTTVEIEKIISIEAKKHVSFLKKNVSQPAKLNSNQPSP